MRDYEMVVSRPIRIGERVKRPKLIMKLITQQHDDFTDNDIAKILFAIEFAANGHSELPIRVHIQEVQQ